MKNMLKSRKFVIIGLLVVAIFFIGGILGSLIPNATMYLMIAAVAVAAVLLIVFGYTGYEKEKTERY